MKQSIGWKGRRADQLQKGRRVLFEVIEGSCIVIVVVVSGV